MSPAPLDRVSSMRLLGRERAVVALGTFVGVMRRGDASLYASSGFAGLRPTGTGRTGAAATLAIVRNARDADPELADALSAVLDRLVAEEEGAAPGAGREVADAWSSIEALCGDRRRLDVFVLEAVDRVPDHVDPFDPAWEPSPDAPAMAP